MSVNFLTRLFDEDLQLRDRIQKLESFILGDKFDELPDVDKSDLREQLGHMKAYSTVLSRRVSRQCNNA